MKRPSLPLLAPLAALAASVILVVACSSPSAGNGSTTNDCTALATCCNSATGSQSAACLEALSTNEEPTCATELTLLLTAGACGTTSTVGTTTSSGNTTATFTETESSVTFTGTTVATGTGTGTGTFIDTTTGSTATATFTETSKTSGSFSSFGSFNPQQGDVGNSCSPPQGGLACTPGLVDCGSTSCPLPSAICCDVPGESEVCQPSGAACAGTPIACNEAADCEQGEICCIHSTGTTASSARVSCQPGPTCPDPGGSIASAQICRSNNECASGECSFWTCVGTTVEACANPIPNAPSLCTRM